MKDEELMKRGEDLIQRYLEADRKATPEQREMARRIVEQHLSEYSHSYAAVITQLVEEGW